MADLLRVALLGTFVPPYRRRFLERLAATPGWKLAVMMSAATEFDRSWPVAEPEIDLRIVRGLSLERRTVTRSPIRFVQHSTLHLPIGLWGELGRFRPDVVISLELGVRTALAAAYCELRRIPLVIRAYHSRSSAASGGVRRWWRRWLLGRARTVIGMGRQAREALLAWGVEGDRILDTLNSPDTEQLLARLAAPELEERVRRIRREVAEGRRLALVSGRLVPLKGTAPLLAAWGDLPETVRDRWRLVFVGDGPLAPLVEAARPLGARLAGFVPVEEMADWYRAADLSIFASLGDVWGLVVNESMICGTPVLCSVHAAAFDDLIEPGRTGLAFDPTDRAAATAALQDALTRVDLGALGAAGRVAAGACSEEGMLAAFRGAVERAVQAAGSGGEPWPAG